MSEGTLSVHSRSKLCAKITTNQIDQEYKNTQSVEDSIPKKRKSWKSSDEFFETQDNACIEEFEEESPNSKSDFVSSGSISKLITQRNLTQIVEQKISSLAVAKSCRSDIKNLSREFEPGFHQTVKVCEDESSEESGCEPEPDIQESTQESVRSEDILIECSTSSNTKSTQVRV